MAYSPSQTAMARANIFGQAAGNIQNLVINASQNIGKIIKDKNINKRIDAAYQNAANNFVQQAKNVGIDETSAKIKSQYFFRKLSIEGLDTETRVKNLLASGMRAEEYLSRMQSQAEQQRLTQQKATSAQAAVSGGREYGTPSQIGAPGGTFTEQNITETAPPAQYQEEAIGTYGQMQAEGRAPVQPAKELREQAPIAALPKRPEPPKPMTEYQKAMLKLKKDANDISRMKASKGDTEQLDKNLKWAQDRQDDVAANEMKYNEKLTKLRQAKVKINAGKKLNDEAIDFLTGEGIDATNLTGPLADMRQLDDAISGYQDLLTTVEDLKSSADETVKALVETRSLSKAISKGREKQGQSKEQQKEAAYRYIKNNATPTLYTSVDVFLNAIPRNLRTSVEDEIEEAKSMGASDQEILQALKIKTQQVR